MVFVVNRGEEEYNGNITGGAFARPENEKRRGASP